MALHTDDYLINIFKQHSKIAPKQVVEPRLIRERYYGNLASVSNDVSSELKRLKKNLHQIVKENKIDLTPLSTENEALADRILTIRENALKIDQDINFILKKKLKDCSQEIMSTVKSLEEHRLILSTLTKITAVHAHLEASIKHLNAKLYLDCSLSLKEAEHILNCSQELSALLFFRHLNQERITIREQLLYDMSQLWMLAVNIDRNVNNEEINVVIEVDTGRLTDVKQIIQVFYCIGNDSIMQKFFKKLKELVFLPIVLNECVLSDYSTENKAVLNMTAKEYVKPNYTAVFQNVVILVDFIFTHLNVNVQDHGNFISKLGEATSKDLIACLIKNCISEAIPSHPGQREGFSHILKKAEEFQKALQGFGFLPSNYGAIIDESGGNGLLFTNKMYLSYLDRARHIMKSDLHNTSEFPQIEAPDWKLLPEPVAKAVKNLFNIGSKPILMDSCLISKSAQEVIDLVSSVQEELLRCGQERSLRLLYTIRNIFEVYCAVVPIHHKKLLSSLPQQVAIFHNNCLYFAYRLLILACECRTWNEELRGHYHIFLDEAAALRQLAVTSLENSVSNQRSNIIANLYDSGLASLRQSPALDPDTERSIRQCIRQLQLLRNVWAETLPVHLYSNSMGFLIDEFTQAIVAMVTDAEDISAQTANELIKILAIARDRLPKLFDEPKEVHRLCRKWNRFLELLFVLDSNLDNISDRWASGMGPLADSFSKSEAQGLIRALFRNTERRAIVLSHIYNS